MSTIADAFESQAGAGSPVGPVLGAEPDVVSGTETSAEALSVAVEAVARLGSSSADYDALSDAEVLAGQRDLARLRNLVETRAVWLAKTLAYRSRPELGQQGLAQQQGFFSPEALLQKMTGATKVDARRLVEVGRMLAHTEAADAAAHTAADEEAARRLLDELDESTGADEPDGPGDGSGSPGAADGTAADGSGGAPAPVPWYAPISHAITDGALSVAAAHAIRSGLGDIDSVVTGAVLADAVHTLLGDARTMNLDQLLKRSRRMRDTLDAAGIAVREQKAWDDRYLRIWTLPTGQVCINGLFPPEQGAFLVSTFDSLTGPRRGGVHFVDPARAAWAQSVRDDPRSTDQLTADTFLDLLTAGTEVNPNRMLGGRKPAVRILTTQTPTGTPTRTPLSTPTDTPPHTPLATPTGTPPHTPLATPTDTPATGRPRGQGPEKPGTSPGPRRTPPTTLEPAPQRTRPTTLEPAGGPGPGLTTPGPLLLLRDPDEILAPLPDNTGHGYFEGNPAPISQHSIERLICDSGTITITVDPTGQPIDVGREERLFTPAQRIALAARDGGCRWGDCDKPPAHTEAHHIQHWLRDHGTTDLHLGILLCHPHHRLLHNQGWQILEHRGRYWLRPPATIDPGQTLIDMPSKNPTAR